MSERLDRFSTPSSGQLTVIASIGVSALNDYIRDHVWHKHSGLEVDGIGARRNANCLEFAPYAIITDTAGFSFARYEMQLHALAAHYPEPHWHAAIMLLRQGRMRRFVINCDLPSFDLIINERLGRAARHACTSTGLYCALTGVSVGQRRHFQV